MHRLPRLAVFLLLAATSARGGAQTVRAPVNARLQILAARARTRGGWGGLRHYAQSLHSSEARGLAYFVLGYREYISRQDSPAANDLKISAFTGCSLADLAEYYEGLADEALNRSEQGIAALTGFTTRHPESPLRVRVANLLANLLIGAGHPQQALDVLKAEPAARTLPSSWLLTARADKALQDNLAAAKAYQEIYTRFPNAPEARVAEPALDRLRQRMGANYPELSPQAQTRRARNLFRHGLNQQALSGYDSLLLSAPQSPLAGEWRAGRALCFLALRRYPDAIVALGQPEPKDPEIDAKRLALLVHAYELDGDEPSLIKALDEIYHKYPRSSSYADALAYAGGYFARQGFWQTAARYYAPLAQGFPEDRFAAEAAWRVAWYEVLAGNTEASPGALAGFIRAYPKSGRVPAALYWLGVLEEQQASTGAAQAIYRLLAERYTNTYYGLKARLRLSTTQRAPAAPVASTIAQPDNPFAALDTIIPSRPPPPLAPCHITSQDELLVPYSTLAALSLHDLADQFLEETLARHPADALVSLALARSRSSRHDASGAIFAAKGAAPYYGNYPFDALPEEVWRLLYPRTYWVLVRRYARADRLDPYVVMGLIRQESAFNPRATSYAQARGLMQMEPYTAIDRVRGRLRRRRVVLSLYNPAFNIRAGCLYLRGLLRSFSGNLPETLAAYNAGDIRVHQWITNSKVQDPDEFLETIPFTDTQAYVEMVLRDRMIYRSLLNGKAKFAPCARRRAD